MSERSLDGTRCRHCNYFPCRCREIVDSLPKTKDGVPIWIGDTVWILGEDRQIDKIVITGILMTVGLMRLENAEDIDAYPEWAYSTSEAAEQAKEE